MNEDMKESLSSSREDAVMVSAFQAGNSAAFDKLVLKHKDRVFNLCYWFLGDYQETNDAAQETFIKVFRSLKKFRFESAFSTWLYRIAVNTCRNRLKSSDYRQEKRMVRFDNPGVSEGTRPSVEIGDESRSPMVELERKERRMLIMRAIDSLPTEQKAVVALRDIEGLSYNEIANITGFNLGTVKSKLARARLDLRDKLRGVI
jgi:RNA polymerase sigma-70 factor (ECF subfamily)